MSNDIIQSTHFRDLISTDHLINENERLPGPNGEPGTGLKISEAVVLAGAWWEKQRKQMPGFGKENAEVLVKSSVYMGRPWHELTKQEMLRVLSQWYAHVGINLIIVGKSTSQDGDIKNMGTIRDDAKNVFDVLDTESTHQTTAIGDDDHREVEEWGEEYERLEREDALLDANGKAVNNGKFDRENSK